MGVPARLTRSSLLRTNVIACSSAMFDRSHFGEWSMPALRRRQDFAFWLSLMVDGSEAIGVPFALLTYREMPVSLSSSRHQAARDTWRTYRHHLGMSLPLTIFYLTHYALRGIVRRFSPRLALRLRWMHPVAWLCLKTEPRRSSSSESARTRSRPRMTANIASSHTRLRKHGTKARQVHEADNRPVDCDAQRCAKNHVGPV